MKRLLFPILLACTLQVQAQDWHLNTEPVYFFAKAPNIALDRNISSSLSIGFQYSAIDWGTNGRNLSGFQAFYSRTGHLTQDSEILKVYVGLLSSNTTLLGIETKADPVPLFEILYGYRWSVSGRFTVAVMAGTWFTSTKIYPGISIPVGYAF